MPKFANVLNRAEAAAQKLRGAAFSPDESLLIDPPRRPATPPAGLQGARYWPIQPQSHGQRQDAALPSSMYWYQGVLASPRSISSILISTFALRGFDEQVNQSAPAAVAVAERVVDEPSREMLKRVEIKIEEIDLTNPRQKLAMEAESLLGYSPLRKALKTPGRLKQALAKLEITILDQGSVDKYKAQMVEHFRTANKMSDPTWRVTALGHYTQPVPEFVLQKAVEIKRELPEAQFYIDQLAVDPFLIVSVDGLPDYPRNQSSRNLNAETAAYVEVWAEPKFEATL